MPTPTVRDYILDGIYCEDHRCCLCGEETRSAIKWRHVYNGSVVFTHYDTKDCRDDDTGDNTVSLGELLAEAIRN